MKKYNINQNGKMYQVEVQELGNTAASNAAPVAFAQPTH